MKFLKFFFAIVFCVSCNTPHYVDFFPVHDDGTHKAKVVFLPVTARSEKDFSLAEYLDHQIRYVAMDQGNIYMYDLESVNSVLKHLARDDFLSLCHNFHPADFVVEALVVFNEAVPYSYDRHPGFVVLPIGKRRWVNEVKVRLRICDIRKQETKIILYEVMEKNQLRPTHPEVYSPCHLYVHLAKQIESRIQEIILNAR